MSMKNINFKTTMMGSLICLLCGFFWALCPMFGWSHYALEGSLTQCGIDWASQTFNVISYNVVLFVLGFFFPMILVIYCNVNLMKIVN